MVGILLRVPGPVGGTRGLRARAETLVISIVEESPCDCETTTTASTTSTSTCPSSSTNYSPSSTLTSSANPANSASSTTTNNAAPPSTFPVLPSTKSGIRTLTQTIKYPSTTLTTTLTFTPNPETNNPEHPNPNPNPAPSETIPASLPTPTIIAIIVVVCVVGTALFYVIYRVYVAQRMNPPPASWHRTWDVYPPPKRPPKRPPKPPVPPQPTKGPKLGPGGVSEKIISEEIKRHRDRRKPDVIIEEGSFSSGGKEGVENGRRRSRVVGLRMEQEQWVRMSQRGSDVEIEGAGSEFGNMEEGGDDLIYMRRRGEVRRSRGDRGEVLVVRRVRVEDGRRREGSGSGGERGKKKPADRGRARVRGGQRRAGGRYEMTGAVHEHLEE